ncbi:hypothetical protein DFP72DRAFT_61688 [Ephemerocybe angulata]|uniref:Uncharacterized protein n=1 Tax=Ephemerocybe angulata TaxID=980116 RepID=A0A8H6HDH7_9AGAR|nr:hypothetical protein DFP72DRAFT_61688 [Tulosesus angulatus]
MESRYPARDKLDRTLEAMKSYRLARQILATHDPERWGRKCGGGHEDMRTTFVWIYLSEVSGRIYRLTKTPPSQLHPSAMLATGPATCSLVDPYLVEILGLTGLIQGIVEGCVEPCLPEARVGFILRYCPLSNVFSIQHSACPSSQPPNPKTHILSLLSVAIRGSPLAGGSLETRSPWSYARDCTVRLLDQNRLVLKEADVKLSSHGPRYDKATACRIPPDFFGTLSVSSLRGCTMEQELTLNLNSIFVLCAIRIFSPESRPFSRLIVTYSLECEAPPGQATLASSLNGLTGYNGI